MNPLDTLLDPSPLLRFAEVRLRAVAPSTVAPGHLVGLHELLGTSPEQVRRWRKGQRISRLAADRAACRLGLHPLLIWPEWWPVREPKPTGYPKGRPRGNPHGCSPYAPQEASETVIE